MKTQATLSSAMMQIALEPSPVKSTFYAPFEYRIAKLESSSWFGFDLKCEEEIIFCIPSRQTDVSFCVYFQAAETKPRVKPTDFILIKKDDTVVNAQY